MNVGLALAIVRYIPRAVVDVIADFLAYPLALVAALPIFITTDENGREHIHPFWAWITTHDALIDIGRIDGYFKVWDNDLGRYWARVLWIWRNPAYRVSHWLGFDQTGVDTTRGLYKDARWDSGKPNKAFWCVTNARGQVGFLYQRQGHWGRDFSHIHRWLDLRFTMETQFGWKLYRRDPDKRCMLAFRISPFKKY